MSEQSESKRDGTKLQRNSGRGPYAKGDGLRKYFLVDFKEAAKSFTLNKSVWAKVVTDALHVDPDRIPTLKVILGEGSSKVRLNIVEEAVIFEYEDLRDELETLREEYAELKWKMEGLAK